MVGIPNGVSYIIAGIEDKRDRWKDLARRMGKDIRPILWDYTVASKSPLTVKSLEGLLKELENLEAGE